MTRIGQVRQDRCFQPGGELLWPRYTAMEAESGIEVAAAYARIRTLSKWLLIEQLAKKC